MTSGGRELLKWLALVLMTGDHVNKALLDGQFQGLTDAARVVFPIFALVLAYNLVRVQAIKPALVRLAVAAVIAQPFHWLAFGHPMPFNVLATLAISLGMMLLWIHDKKILVGICAVIFSPWVDYGLAGVALVFFPWLWFRGEKWALFPGILALVGICIYNGNGWALASLPLIAVLGNLDLDVPRWRWAFLGYYVGHLVILAWVATGGGNAAFRAYSGWDDHPFVCTCADDQGPRSTRSTATVTVPAEVAA